MTESRKKTEMKKTHKQVQISVK